MKSSGKIPRWRLLWNARRYASTLAVLAKRRPYAMPSLMADERAMFALGRIERALARIEAAAGRAPAASNNGELHELQRAHQALRGRVEGAIAQIDRLLASEAAQ